jgi:hypothetical protein
VVVEGSNDEKHWKEYHFYHKPGNVSAAPTFCTPHQPRLDWQMWFAALGNIQRNPWLVRLAYHILKGKFCFSVLSLVSKQTFAQTGTPQVLDLIDTERLPFPANQPPKFVNRLRTDSCCLIAGSRFIRCVLYHYHYTFLDASPRTWWKRKAKFVYMEPASLEMMRGWGVSDPVSPPPASQLLEHLLLAVCTFSFDAISRD